MKNKGACPKCGSADIISGVTPLDLGHCNAPTQLRVATYRKPDALVFKGQQAAALTACVCGRCGFVEFYVDDPKALKVEKP